MGKPVARRGWGVYAIIPWSPPTLTFSNMAALSPRGPAHGHARACQREKKGQPPLNMKAVVEAYGGGGAHRHPN